MSNPTLDYLKNRLSLRKPQSESLDILDELADDLLDDSDIKLKLKKIKSKYTWFNDFDRNFPSLCYSIATGVGKTRLMGAFIAYLYITKNIKDFMIIAPNITIYNKLKKEFSDQGNDKYVFKGLREFIQNEPLIIDGENYKEYGKNSFWDYDITINIFNIDKINKEEQSIKALSEYIGQSYYDYLCECKDLVILMDESHHYRANRGMKVLNELKPVLGLELTATPQIEKNGKTVRFNNIIYDYPLRNALLDGYVKNPCVATRKDFNPNGIEEDELDKIKIIDGINIHRNTKIQLEEYSKENNVKLVKPFAMIICKDIDHGEKVMNYVMSKDFFDGYYNKDRVLFINSKEGKTEKDENILKLLNLEHPYNMVEIVIHVNMLKEGWDVNNLYTIIPLRRSASQTLTEQTIGRGLRLPYGKRVNNEIVDDLTIVSHDKYQAIVDEAHKPNSIFNETNIKMVEEMDLKEKEIVTSVSKKEEEFNKLILEESDSNKKAEIIVKKEISNIISNTKNINAEVFNNPSIKEEIINKVTSTDKLETTSVEKCFEEAIKNVNILIEEHKKNAINIPYVSINKQTVYSKEYINFDFDYSKLLNYKPLPNSMIVQHLDDGESFEIILNNDSQSVYSDAKELLFEKILQSPSIEYEKCADILNEKIEEYLKMLNKEYKNDEIINILFNYSKYISNEFVKQINSNIKENNNIVEESIVTPWDKIYSSNYTKYKEDEILDYRTPTLKNDVVRKVFTGFNKAYHNIYKFDSNSEKDFSIILENDDSVLKWLRPAANQFNIYWNKVNKYEPDFIVETKDYIYMVEIKADNQVENEEVQLKKKAAEDYCNIVNKFSMSYSMKEWKYLIIPSTDIMTNYSFDRYI